MDEIHAKAFRRVLTGLDTVVVAYYLVPRQASRFSFAELLTTKERLQASKSRSSAVMRIGSQEFLLRPHGTKSGFPLLLENKEVSIQCGEFNTPSFFVTYRSEALWRQGAQVLHDSFLSWAESVDLQALQPERLSRVDFTFDYEIEAPGFASDHIVSQSAKDTSYRNERTIETLSYGTGDVRLNIYNKVAEIIQKSEKVWFFKLWGVMENVWRIEWQISKSILRRFGIRTFDQLYALQGDLLRYLATEHDTLRIPTVDSNRSRWPLHPLWIDLQAQIESFSSQGVYREIDSEAVLRERLIRIASSVHGYLKRVAAITSLQRQQDTVSLAEAEQRLMTLIRDIYDPLTWPRDVRRKRDGMRLGDD
jgi:hypothetical protein